MRIVYYINIWTVLSKRAFSAVLSQKGSIAIFLFGKILRFATFFLFLYFLVNGTKTLAGYTLNQVLFIFLTFNLVDILSQFLYRDVYRFRPLIINGGFDLLLSKPISALFRSLMGGADFIDLLTIPPLLILIVHIGSSLNPTTISIFLYVLLIINALVIATAFHIGVLALGIITLEIDHTIMIFRDFLALGRLPVEIYRPPLRFVLIYLLPIGTMITVPATALMGLINAQTVLISFSVGLGLLFLSLRFWKYALKFYTSASS